MWVEWKGQNVGKIHTKGHTKSLASGRIGSCQISTTEGASEQNGKHTENTNQWHAKRHWSKKIKTAN